MAGSSLLFDDTLELCDPDGRLSGGSYWFEVLADGASWGDAQPVEVAINSLMRDGAIVSTMRDENREATFLVKVRATDSGALDKGVQALQRATRKRTTLVWTPPDGYCDPRVWDVETSNLLESNGFDDLAYMLRNEQVFRLRLVCLPYRRSAVKTVDNAGTPPSTGGTLLLSCESTTGWAATSSAPLGSQYVVDTTIFTQGAGSIRSRTQSYTSATSGSSRSKGSDRVSGLSLSTGTGGYLSISVRFQWTKQAFTIFVTTSAGGRQQVVAPVATKLDAAGFVHYVWPVAAGLTITALDFEWAQTGPGIAAVSTNPHYIWYDDVEILPSATTDHQIVKQLDVKGSARTPGSLHIAAPSDTVALGQVLAVSAPTSELPPGFQPDGRRWVTQGVTTTDSTSPDGSYFTPNSTAYDASSASPAKPIFDVPAAMLTAGPYTIVALVKAEASSLTFGVQAQLRVGSSNVGPTSAAQVSPLGLTTGWQFITVGTVYLPPLPMQDADASTTKVRLLFKGAKFSNVYMVPAWQVAGRPAADFSIVDCGTGSPAAGGSSSNLWIDSPSTSQPQGGWWRGPTSDRGNTQSAWPDAKKPGIHMFSPEPMTVFLVAANAQGPTLTLEYYEAYL